MRFWRRPTCFLVTFLIGMSGAISGSTMEGPDHPSRNQEAGSYEVLEPMVSAPEEERQSALAPLQWQEKYKLTPPDFPDAERRVEEYIAAACGEPLPVTVIGLGPYKVEWVLHLLRRWPAFNLWLSAEAPYNHQLLKTLQQNQRALVQFDSRLKLLSPVHTELMRDLSLLPAGHKIVYSFALHHLSPEKVNQLAKRLLEVSPPSNANHISLLLAGFSELASPLLPLWPIFNREVNYSRYCSQPSYCVCIPRPHQKLRKTLEEQLKALQDLTPAEKKHIADFNFNILLSSPYFTPFDQLSIYTLSSLEALILCKDFPSFYHHRTEAIAHETFYTTLEGPGTEKFDLGLGKLGTDQWWAKSPFHHHLKHFLSQKGNLGWRFQQSECFKKRIKDALKAHPRGTHTGLLLLASTHPELGGSPEISPLEEPLTPPLKTSGETPLYPQTCPNPFKIL